MTFSSENPGWRRILLRQARKASVRQLDYPPPAGSLRAAQSHLSSSRRTRAVVCDRSEVIVVNGSQQALDLVARAPLAPGTRVATRGSPISGKFFALLERSRVRWRSTATA